MIAPVVSANQGEPMQCPQGVDTLPHSLIVLVNFASWQLKKEYASSVMLPQTQFDAKFKLLSCAGFRCLHQEYAWTSSSQSLGHFFASLFSVQVLFLVHDSDPAFHFVMVDFSGTAVWHGSWQHFRWTPCGGSVRSGTALWCNFSISTVLAPADECAV